jgi:hypothetical protein
LEKNIPQAVTFDIFSVACSVAQRAKQKLRKRIPPFFRGRSMNPDQSSKQFSRCHVSSPSPAPVASSLPVYNDIPMEYEGTSLMKFKIITLYKEKKTWEV